MCDHQFINELEGDTIDGSHIFVFKCVRCGILNIEIETELPKALLFGYEEAEIAQEKKRIAEDELVWGCHQ